MNLSKLPWKRIAIFSAVFLACMLLLGLLFFWYLISSAPDIDSLEISPIESATYICDQDGNYLRKLAFADANRDIVTLDEIPDTLQNAIIAIEDSRFYEHNGIDTRGILRAFWKGFTQGSFSEGASTITQQLIKNRIFTEWMSETSFYDRLKRKVQEQYLAVQLEKQVSKEEILEDYLNTINFGAGCYGVQSAARHYFGKEVQALTLSESAVLAAIPQNPSALNPLLYPEANQKRQKTVLHYMEEQSYISETDHAQALSDPVYSRILSFHETREENSVYTYYEDALIEQAADVLTHELGLSPEQASQALYGGGLRIYSAQDPSLQQICDEEFQNSSNFPENTEFGIDYALSITEADGLITHYDSNDLKNYVQQNLDPSFQLMCTSEEKAQEYANDFRTYVLDAPSSTAKGEPASPNDARTVLAERLTLSPQPQASLTLIEQQTGYVRAIIGGRGEKTASLTLNRAVETTRQPGSTFKILAAYAPALDTCGQTLATSYENEPYTYTNGVSVSNWDLNDYSGSATIREAITRSINVIAVKCITALTPELGFSYARNFGISTLHESYQTADGTFTDVIQPLALGGITEGVTNLELCSAYAAIADGGLYHTPRFFTKILDQHGNLVFSYEPESSDVIGSLSYTDTGGSSFTDAGGSSFTDTGGSSTRDSYRVIREETAFLLTSAMQDVISSPSGTAYGTISAAKQPVAGKTGTTSSYKDIWFVGYTPYYTCCIWGGYDNNQELPSGCHSYNKVLWSSIMNRIHADLPAADFTRPETITEVLLCQSTHQIARPGICPETYTEYFVSGTAPAEECSLHKPAPETEIQVIYPDILELLTETTLPKSNAEGESDSSDSDAETKSEPSDPDADTKSDPSGSGADAESEPSDPDADAKSDPSNSDAEIQTDLSDIASKKESSELADTDILSDFSAPADGNTSLDELIRQLEDQLRTPAFS